MNLPTENHKELIRILNRLGLEIDVEVQVRQYSLDCYCYNLHVGFEADTKTTHMKGRDRKRDKWIMDNYQIPILRIDVGEHKDRRALEVKVLEFIEKWADTAEERRGTFIPNARWIG